jgi:hypothetical protein
MQSESASGIMAERGDAMTVKARFDGKVFVPEGPVDLPVGQTVHIEVESVNQADVDRIDAEFLAKIAALPVNENGPRDLAAQHDHYLYGMPKRP